MFGSLLKATVGLVVETPVSLVADAVTLGGLVTDKDTPYTAESLSRVYDNIKDATR